MDKRKQKVIKNNKIFCVLGYTSSGKTTIVKEISRQLNIPQLVTNTSRPKREGEVDGVDYNFVDREMFIDEFDSFLEQRHYNVANGDTWYYGIHKSEFEKTPYGLLITDRGGFDEVVKNIGKENIVSIFIEVPITELCKRHIGRADDDAEFERRLKDDILKFNGFISDYIITNTSVAECINKLKSIITYEIMECGL